MILASPAYLPLLALSVGIVLLYFLTARPRRHEVSALFLWEGSPSDPRTRAARVRVRIDVLLLLQVLILTAAVLALAEPAFPTRAPRLNGMAIVLDGSASVRAASAGGRPIADLCRSEASALLDAYPTTPVAVFELSTSPRVLAPLSTDHAHARRVISAWEPTWFADGTSDDLSDLLSSQGGTYERIVFLTDGAPALSLAALDTVSFPPGENVALTAFSVREDPSGMGSIAFARVRNDATSDYEGALRVGDGARRASVSVYLAPGEEQAFVLPFPASVGPLFTAAIDAADSFAADDSRVASLGRRTEWRIRIVGEPDRYLRAALASIGTVRFLPVTDPSPADVTVAYGVSLPDDTPGGVLLVHSSLAGIVEVGDDRDGAPGPLVANAPTDPLLTSVDPLDFVIRRAPTVRLLVDGLTLLSAGGQPLLWRAALPDRRIVVLAPDPLLTNLPLCVDFPILVWNIVRWLSLVNPSAPPTAALVGEPIPFAPYGIPERLVDPSNREMWVDANSAGFVAKAPGIYRLSTSSGTYAVAVNVGWNESPRGRRDDAVTPSRPAEAQARLETAFYSAWPIAAAVALTLVIVECILFQRLGLPRRRT
ncbi:MAG: BatA and WFA domain-containing protein [Candidatus Bipolaricaulis sp.]|nr:BatA and WFA domain-containing protein [Candidatus Bipolaricaulis sp.]